MSVAARPASKTVGVWIASLAVKESVISSPVFARAVLALLLAIVTGKSVGGVLSTLKVPLGPAAEAVFPAVSEAVPAAIEMPRLPSPVMLESVTVRVLPVPLTPIVAVAVPAGFNVILPLASVLALKLVSV